MKIIKITTFIAIVFLCLCLLSGCINKDKIYAAKIEGNEIELVEATNKDITEFTIPNNITNVAAGAFIGCYDLVSITIPENVKSIGFDAFFECSNLKNVYYKGTIENWCNISLNNIYSNPMYYASHFYMLGSNREYHEVTEIEIPSTIKEIGNCQFYGLDKVTTITIPDGIVSIDEYAFKNCNNLTNVYYNGTIKDWCNITFENEYSNPMNYASHFYMLDSNNEYYEVTEIEIPNTITGINNYQFREFNNVIYIKIPKGVISIGNDAFAGCSSLTNVYYAGTIKDWCNIMFETKHSNPMYYAGHFYMLNENNEYYEVKEINIPNTVDYINYNQFYSFENIASITIPDSVINIGESAFEDCKIETATIPAIAASYINNSNLKEVIITSVESIGQYAFRNCSNLMKIVIPNSVKSIGTSAFEGCSSLASVYYNGTIKDWCSIMFENEYSNPMHYANHFYMLDDNNEYYEVKEIEIPNTITEIGNYQFWRFYNITYITIPDSVVSIGEMAFYFCRRLTSITIPDSVKSIGSHAFYYCSNLTSITIPSSVTSIGDWAFYDCWYLTNIIFDGTIFEWASISKGKDWNYHVTATKVICSDGEVNIK